MKRRDFIHNSVVAATAFSVVPNRVLGFSSVAPNNKIQLGFIGAGKQGLGLMNNFINYDIAEVVAVSEVDIRKLEFFQEKFQKGMAKKGKAAQQLFQTTAYRELLERKDIDAVVIASPDHWHAQMAIDAAKAGKDIYCEKPLSSTVGEGRAMVQAARKYKRVFQTGSMQRSWENFRHGVELIRNGYIGKITEVHVAIGEPYKSCDLPTQKTPATIDWDAWIGPAPYRGYHKDLACPLEDKRWGLWRYYKPFGGGMISDWGAHMFDIVQWALAMDDSGPTEFHPPAFPAEKGLRFIYANGITVTHKQWGSSNNEIQFVGTDGRLEVSRSYLKTYPNTKLATTPLATNAKRVYKSENHHLDWLNAIVQRTQPICDVEIGHRTATVCNLVNIAYELQRPLLWDPEKEIFTNDQSANLLLDRTYRGKWSYSDF